MTAFGCVVLTQGHRPASSRPRSTRCRARRASSSTSSSSATAGSPTGLPDGVQRVALAEDRGIPAGRNAGVRRTSAASSSSSSTTTPRLAEPDALARVAARFAATRASGCSSCASRLATAGRRRATGCRGCGSATPRAERRHRGLGGRGAIRRAVFEQVGGWPEEFRFAHEGVDLAWRVMDAGHRVATPATSGPAPAVAPAAARLLGLLRRPQPRLARAAQPAVAARRPLCRPLRAAHPAGPAHAGARPRRCAATAPGSASPAASAAPAVNTLWRMTRAGRPPVI